MIRASQRACEYARKHGWPYANVERWTPPRPPKPGENPDMLHGKRHDAFGWIDMIVIYDAIIGVQACSMSTRAAHLAKIQADQTVLNNIQKWVVNGGHAELWAFAKHKMKRGGVAARWELVVTNLRSVL